MKKLIYAGVILLFTACSTNQTEQQTESMGAGVKKATESKSKAEEKSEQATFSLDGKSLTLTELKVTYLETEHPSAELQTIVDSLIEAEGNCNCTVCHWPSHCTWGDDCSYQKNIPCSWCC